MVIHKNVPSTMLQSDAQAPPEDYRFRNLFDPQAENPASDIEALINEACAFVVRTILAALVLIILFHFF